MKWMSGNRRCIFIGVVGCLGKVLLVQAHVHFVLADELTKASLKWATPLPPSFLHG